MTELTESEYLADAVIMLDTAHMSYEQLQEECEACGEAVIDCWTFLTGERGVVERAFRDKDRLRSRLTYWQNELRVRKTRVPYAMVQRFISTLRTEITK